MRAWHRLISTLRLLISPRVSERELDADVRSYLDLLAEENMREGMVEDEAIRRARMQIGGLEQLKETVRRARYGAFWEQISRNVRLGVRRLSRNRGFTMTAVLTVGIGIGSTAAVYGISRAVLESRIVGASDPETLAVVLLHYSDAGYVSPGYNYYLSLRTKQDVFSSLAAYRRLPVVLSSDSQVTQVNLEADSGNYFTTLGVTPHIGRLLQEEDENDASKPSAVISHRLWRNRFDGDPNVTGKPLKLNGREFLIVGVAPEGFVGVQGDWFSPPDVWVTFQGIFGPGGPATEAFVGMMGRLKSGTSLEYANERTNKLLHHLVAEFPAGYQPEGIEVVSAGHSFISPVKRIETQRFLTMLFIVSALILVASCSNVANFLIAYGPTRRKEMAVQLALGGTRSHLLQQLFIEAALLAVAASLVGLAVSWWLIQIVRELPSTFSRVPVAEGSALSLAADTAFSMPIVIFNLAVTMGLCLLFGLIPAFLTSTNHPLQRMKEQVNRWNWSRARLTPRQLLFVLQVSLSVILAITAGWYAQSYTNTEAIDLGYRTESLVLARVDAGAISAQDRPKFYRELLATINGHPRVEFASLAVDPPLSMGRNYISPHKTDRLTVSATFAGPGLFEALGVPVTAGREFNGSPEDVQSGLVVNQTLADELWPGKDPIGRTVRFGLLGHQSKTIVGVVDFDRCRDLFSSHVACAWRAAQPGSGAVYLHIRTDGKPEELLSLVGESVARLDREVAVSDVKTFDNYIADVTAVQRLGAIMTGFLALLGLTLTAIGCFSLFASMINDRIKEIGIRMALGATPSEIAAPLTLRALALAGIGIVLGCGASIIANRGLATQLFQVEAFDGVTLAGASIAVLVIASIASYIPARTATRNNISSSLNQD